MYKKSFWLIGAILPILLLLTASCRKYLDVNKNPNIVTEVEPKLLLPSAQVAIGTALGVDMNINGAIWVQYWTQSTAAGQYKYLEQGQPTANRYDRVWQLFYSQALPDLKKIQEGAAKNNLKQYRAISLLLTAYCYQVITDAWGDVPFSEALKGQAEDGGIISPHFDKQADIYDGIVKMIDTASSLINAADPLAPGADDLMYGGDMDEWQKFANTLRLKVFMRLSEVNPAKAQAGVQQTMAQAGATGFIGINEDAQIKYYSISGNQNPLYLETKFLGQNQVASSTSVDSMKSDGDPRLTKVYVGPTVVGQAQGITVLPAGVTISNPAAITGALASSTASALAPVIFISATESKFLQAEAVARSWGTSTFSDSALFRQGIIASFLYLGVDTSTTAAKTYMNSSYWGRYPVSGTVNQKIRHIITQKWFAMNGTQGFEAWTEWRRTGYPDFLVLPATSQIKPKFPTIFLYPDVEVSRNANFPGQKQVTDRVYWDIN